MTASGSFYDGASTSRPSEVYEDALQLVLAEAMHDLYCSDTTDPGVPNVVMTEIDNGRRVCTMCGRDQRRFTCVKCVDNAHTISKRRQLRATLDERTLLLEHINQAYSGGFVAPSEDLVRRSAKLENTRQRLREKQQQLKDVRDKASRYRETSSQLVVWQKEALQKLERKRTRCETFAIGYI